MLKLWGRVNSINVQKVLWALEELKVPYERAEAGMAFGVVNEPFYKKMNPNSRVPTIDDDGFVLWESAGINLYLAEKYRSPLWPADARAKGRMLQWAFFTSNDIEPNMVTVMQHRAIFPPEKRNPALADDADAKLQAKLKVLDDHLARNRFFGGDRWDMADFMVASVCYSFFAMKYDLSRYPHFQQWLMASIERPKAKEARALRE